jgi:hypothetical protein
MRKYAAFFIAAICWTVGAFALAADTVCLVEQSQPQATVVVPAQCHDQTRLAAGLLVSYIKRSTGAALPIVESPAPEQSPQWVTVHVGQDDYVKSLKLDFDELDDDGYVIVVPDEGHLVIAGPTPYGAEFGVCEFLERYVGVRWLMPGPHGDDVPRHESIRVPKEEVRGEPAFFSRLFSGLQGSAQVTWARRNRMHGRVQFHHNLHRLIPPETYVKTHPHFYPLRNGQRYFPADNNTHGWQPCFSAEGLVEEAIKNICRYFEEHPDAPSYSLGVIDSGGHCECEDCQAKDTGLDNFIGRRDVSDRYYEWCNKVAEGVLEKHPDKVFGCLAYSEVAQPPSRVKVNTRIIPYMTYDRMKWIDPELRASGEEMTRRWHAASPAVGWYDYIYGSHYCVPRVWFHHMGDYYRFGHAHGVRAMYAEAYPHWGEGPKLYVSLKLQWDPNQNVDQLLDDWYTRAVGEGAASDLAAYYALWEDFWTRRILDSDWYTQGGQYLAFHTPTYLADVTEQDVTKSRALLESVVEKAKTREQKTRAKTLMLAFEYYEASALAYAGNRLAEESIVQSEAQALDVLDKGEVCLRMAKRRQQLLMEEMPKHPALMHNLTFTRRPKLKGDQWGAGLLWTAFDQIDRSAAVRNRLTELAASKLPEVSIPARTMLTLANSTAKSIVENPSFEAPQRRWPSQWSPWVKWGTGTMKADPKAAHSGDQGVLLTGVKRGGPNQSIPVVPGRYASVAYVRVPQQPAGSATITLSMTPMDENGHNLTAISTTIKAQACDWTRIAAAGELPEVIDGKKVKTVRLIIVIDGLEPGEEIHVDDMAMFKIQ